MGGTYINPFTDFGFKKLFGEEANKDLLIDFLNQLLVDKGPIMELTYLKSEHLGARELDRKAIFDLYCQNERGERFIVELQKAKQKFFKDRSLYYASFAMQEQGRTGEWNYRMRPVYTVSIMDFSFDESEPDQFLHDVQLIERHTQRVFSDALRCIYLEMPKFKKTEDELETRFDKWLYVIRNLSRLERVPLGLQERIFNKFFDAAQLANFNRDDQQAYQDSLKYYRDMKNSLDTMYEEGLEEGRQQGRQQIVAEMAQTMRAKGLSDADILSLTGLTQEQLDAL